MSDVKPTPGPMFPQDNGREPPFVSDPEGNELPRTFANMAFIADAFTIHHETGLTPRQLAEQRAELLEALEVFMGRDDRFTVAVGGNPNAVQAMLDRANSIIAKARGGSDA